MSYSLRAMSRTNVVRSSSRLAALVAAAIGLSFALAGTAASAPPSRPMPSAQHRQEIKAEMAKAAAACDRNRYNELVEKLAREYELMAEPEWAGSIRYLTVDSERITTEFKNPIAARFRVPIFPSDCAPPAAAVEQPGTGPIQSLFGPATLPALEQNSPQPTRPANQTAYGGPYGSPNVTATVDVVNAHSTWKITSPTDQVKTTSDTPQLQFTGQINWGPFYLSGTAMGAGNARGSFSDTFFGFPVATTGTVTSGSNNAFTTSAGFNFFNVAAGLSVGAFGLYDLNLESLYGNTAFSWSGQLSLLETRSQAAGGGLIVNDAFTVGNVPFLFSGSIAGLADNVKSGMFDGNGSGWQANARLTFPLGPVHGNLFAQYTDINASGNVLGSPLTFDNRTWQFGGGITATFSFEPDNSGQFGGR